MYEGQDMRSEGQAGARPHRDLVKALGFILNV